MNMATLVHHLCVISTGTLAWNTPLQSLWELAEALPDPGAPWSSKWWSLLKNHRAGNSATEPLQTLPEERGRLMVRCTHIFSCIAIANNCLQVVVGAVWPDYSNNFLQSNLKPVRTMNQVFMLSPHTCQIFDRFCCTFLLQVHIENESTWIHYLYI